MPRVRPQKRTLLTPRAIYSHLDQHVVGQDRAKRVLAVAAYGHLRRCGLPTERKGQIRKSNILLIGPTGSGKTHLVQKLSQVLDVPLSIADATEYTEAGYYGKDVEQLVYLVESGKKLDLLLNLLRQPEAASVMVFANRRDQVRRLHERLARAGIPCGILSGEVPQHKRMKTLESFRSGEFRVLVATDVAGRGIHVEGVTHVVNFTLPEDPDDYVHRIGRTGRAGATGTSISFACEDDAFLLPQIEELLGQKLACLHPSPELLERRR